MIAFYNDNDPTAAEWLIDLSLGANLIPRGVVDCRSITDIQGDELGIYRQCHFFAGIGGWPYALQLAGWPADREVWTGSCPCQPFSCAGKQKGIKDERHLWPEFLRLIKECRPQTIFGEQVASSEVIGTQLEASFLVAVQNGDYARANKLAKRLAQSNGFHYWARWIDRVQADLAAEGYAVRFKVLGAHSVRAPHIRQRLYWVAYRESVRDPKFRQTFSGKDSSSQVRSIIFNEFGSMAFRDGTTRRVPHCDLILSELDGLSSRVAQLRGLGNAIVPQVAAAFVKAFMEVIG